MPTTIEVVFPWGRYHATPWGRNVNEGAIDWPPSPWRLLRALYATWQARLPELDEALIDRVLDALSDPPEYWLPPHTEAHSRHFMPDNRFGTDKAFDTFAVLPRGGRVVMSWPGDLDPDGRRALAQLLERLPYLGRAESICVARLVAEGEVPDKLPDEVPCVPLERADSPLGPTEVPARVLVPVKPLDIRALTARTVEVRKAKRLDPPGSQWIDYTPVSQYRPPFALRRGSIATVEAVRFSLEASALPALTSAVVMADALRRAALRRLDGTPSQALSGKDADGKRVDDDHAHAHFIAFCASSNHQLIDTLAVWAPGGLGEVEQQALASIRHLDGENFRRARGFRPVRVAVEAYGSAGVVVPELVGPARTWESWTPYAPPRNKRKSETWEDHAIRYLLRDVRTSGLPSVVSATTVKGPWLDFRRYRIDERIDDGRRAYGMRVTFEEPIEGPLLLGALRHFGLGLFRPVPT